MSLTFEKPVVELEDRCTSVVEAQHRHILYGVNSCRSRAIRRTPRGAFLTYQSDHFLHEEYERRIK